MAMDLAKVQTALRAVISQSKEPTEAQVYEISGMTQNGEAFKQLQRMIQRRVRHAEEYPPQEIHQTLVLMQKCLATASRDFVAFCTTLLPTISVLTRYGPARNTALTVIYGLIRSRAKSLYEDLVNPARLSEKRHIILGETTTAMISPPTHVATRPLSTPPTENKKLPQLTSRITGLPTPDPSPEAFSNLALHGRSHKTVREETESLKTRNSRFTSLILLKNEEVAGRTFISEDLDIILRIFDETLRVNTSHRNDPNDIAKALTLVHHCLYWGSYAFVTHFQGIKSDISALRRHPADLVRSRAEVVVDLLNDSSRLRQEREFREKIMGRGPKSSPNPSNDRQVPPSPLTSSNIMRKHIQEPVPDLSQYVKRLGTQAVVGGGFADVWRGEYTTQSGIEIVAIKILRRLKKIPPERLDKRRNRELRVWSKLCHENIVPFYGVIIDEDGDIGMISPYYSEGNIVEYLKINRNVDPLTMLQKIIEGIAYLHDKKIVHGDIKGSNVMINEGSPRLIDFGLAQFIDGIDTGYATSSIATSLRWSAPELLIGDSETSSKSKKSDIYSFASLSVEIMTLRSPYHPLRDPQVMNHVLKGVTPERPSMAERWSPGDELWELLRECWRIHPQDRPDIEKVRRKLAEFSPYITDS